VPVNGTVEALAPVGRRLIVGGDYEKIGGKPHTSLAAVDLESGAVEEGFNPAPKKVRGRRGVGRFNFADIAALLPTKDRLLVGGDFSTSGKRPRAGLVALRLRDSALDRRFDARLGGDQDVRALALTGKTLYVGGDFARIVRYVKVRRRGKLVRRPVLRNGLVALDAATGRARPAFNAGTGGFETVAALALRGSELVAGGQFHDHRWAPARQPRGRRRDNGPPQHHLHPPARRRGLPRGRGRGPAHRRGSAPPGRPPVHRR